MKKNPFLFLEIAVLILGVLFIFKIQFLNSTIYGADGYLHIRMAQFLKNFGVNYKFHWARYSVFFERFSDKDFLFHALLIPFTYVKNIFLGAKIAAAVFYCLLFFVVYIFLRKWSKRELVFVFLLIFFFSYKFVLALSRPRPFPLVIILTILALVIWHRFLLLLLLSGLLIRYK